MEGNGQLQVQAISSPEEKLEASRVRLGGCLPVQTGRGTHPASYTKGNESLPGVKRPGRGVDHLQPFSAEVKERLKLYLYCISGPLWPVVERILPLHFTFTF
jgi:hypothetical protein